MKQESDVLRSYLKKAQDDITTLLDEKRRLLDTVRTLQVCFTFFIKNAVLVSIRIVFFFLQPNFFSSRTNLYRTIGITKTTVTGSIIVWTVFSAVLKITILSHIKIISQTFVTYLNNCRD